MATKRTTPKPSKKKAKKSTPKAPVAKPHSKKPAKKTAKKAQASKKNVTAEQRRARKALLSYIDRLGKRKAARRLDSTVTEIETWLRTWKIPDAIKPEVLGLDTSGGGFTYIRGTRLADALKKLKPRKLSQLTGLPVKRIDQILKRRPNARVKVERNLLQKIGPRIGWENLADQLGTKPSLLKSVSEFPQTDTTIRLKDFAAQYGDDMVAYYIGVDTKVLKRWLRTNVPRDWEKDLNRIIGRKSDQGIHVDELKARVRDPKSLNDHIAEAIDKTNRWNKQVEYKYRIAKKTAIRWAKLREFDEQFKILENNWKLAQKESKRTKPQTIAAPPVEPPPPLPPPLFPTQPPELPKPPRRTNVPPIPKAIDVAMKDFLGKRAEAVANNQNANYRPIDSFGNFTPWKGTTRKGYRFYGKVAKFVIVTDLTTLGNQIISNAREMWRLISGPGEYMSIRFTFSAQGSGNPFYPGAFEPDKTEFNFFNRNTDIIPEPHMIDRAVRAVLSEIWDVSQDILMFFEHYEIVKSVPINTPQ